LEISDYNDPRNLGFTAEEVTHAQKVGIDLGLLHENLQLTPAERADQHDAAVAEMLELQGSLTNAREPDGD